METEKQEQLTDMYWHEIAVLAKENCEYHYCDDYCILFDFAECPAIPAEEYSRW